MGGRWASKFFTKIVGNLEEKKRSNKIKIEFLSFSLHSKSKNKYCKLNTHYKYNKYD